MVVVLLGSTMSIIDTTIVNIALDRLSHDLHTPLNEIQWVVSAYLLTIAAVVPVSGWAGRRFGPGRVYLVSLAVFTVGSALCAVATTAPELYAFRVVQGLGGGLLMPIGMTILVQAAAPKNLAKVLATISGLKLACVLPVTRRRSPGKYCPPWVDRTKIPASPSSTKRRLS